jgi:hypothetical protein
VRRKEAHLDIDRGLLFAKQLECAPAIGSGQVYGVGQRRPRAAGYTASRFCLFLSFFRIIPPEVSETFRPPRRFSCRLPTASAST